MDLILITNMEPCLIHATSISINYYHASWRKYCLFFFFGSHQLVPFFVVGFRNNWNSACGAVGFTHVCLIDRFYHTVQFLLTLWDQKKREKKRCIMHFVNWGEIVFSHLFSWLSGRPLRTRLSSVPLMKTQNCQSCRKFKKKMVLSMGALLWTDATPL